MSSGPQATSGTTPPPASGAGTAGHTYPTPAVALEAVRSDFNYWSEKLTDTSLQLSFAVIAANWAVFGSVNKVLENDWAKYSLFLVLLSLGISLAGSKWMSELHRVRYEYAESDPARWEREFTASVGRRVAWPFTDDIERLGRILRLCKTWLPLGGGVLFLAALILS